MTCPAVRYGRNFSSLCPLEKIAFLEDSAISLIEANAKMPLSENASTNETAGTIVKTLQGAFGTPAGYRPGMLRTCKESFTSQD